MARIGIVELAFAFSIVGALALLIINLLMLLGIADVIIPFYQLVPSRYLFPHIGGMGGDIIINIICGIIALIGSQKIHAPVWAIILMIAGIISGGVGGVLILIGGILALVGDIA